MNTRQLDSLTSPGSAPSDLSFVIANTTSLLDTVRLGVAAAYWDTSGLSYRCAEDRQQPTGIPRQMPGVFLYMPRSYFYPPRIIGFRLTNEPHYTYGGTGMDEHQAALGVEVALGPGSDAEEVARATLQLRRELLTLDVDAVETPGAGEPPPGSRGVDVAVLGALVVYIADPQLLPAVVAVAQSWLAVSSRRSIKLELGGDALELTGVSSQEQRRLADEWLARH